MRLEVQRSSSYVGCIANVVFGENCQDRWMVGISAGSNISAQEDVNVGDV